MVVFGLGVSEFTFRNLSYLEDSSEPLLPVSPDMRLGPRELQVWVLIVRSDLAFGLASECLHWKGLVAATLATLPSPDHILDR